MHIKPQATVMIPVSDQNRALAFYVEMLGFRQRVDFEYADGVRWVEVEPVGEGSPIGLSLALDRQAGIETRVALNTGDLEADHAELERRGVDVGPILREGDPVVHWGGIVLGGSPPMCLVRDPDGNSLLLVQGP
jgi:catechol 2,3-dioxygenase-like lactoylglutathione lyase family enzyme